MGKAIPLTCSVQSLLHAGEVSLNIRRVDMCPVFLNPNIHILEFQSGEALK
jgi:hypothetical protein